MVQFLEAVPILAVRDLARAMEHYRALGFEVSAYTSPDGGTGEYGYASRGSVRLHLSQSSSLDPLTTQVSLYLYVDDADALYAEWEAVGAEGRMHAPRDTDYGLREGAHVDSDGNLVRFGSSLDVAPQATDAHRH